MRTIRYKDWLELLGRVKQPQKYIKKQYELGKSFSELIDLYYTDRARRMKTFTEAMIRNGKTL